MFYSLVNYIQQFYPIVSVFHYITLRAMLSAITALLICLMFGPTVIRKLGMAQIGQVIRTDGPESHFSKQGTPTMGGILIIISIVLTTLLWGNLNNSLLWLAILVTSGYGVIGWLDDYKKLILKDPKGLIPRWKFFWQAILALLAAVFLYFYPENLHQQVLYVPFLKKIIIPIGMFYIALTFFVIVGTSNAVNLTDGLDGLAIMPIVLVTGALGIFAYVTSHFQFASYLALPYINGVEELVVFCAAVVGAGLGFLWFNAYPAQIFMGDVGSLGLGAAIGLVAVLVRQELMLVVMGGVFVIETFSVILQVGSFKLRGKRIFKMAPLHHHFELIGWPEPRVIVRFWIITVILVLFGLASLKLR